VSAVHAPVCATLLAVVTALGATVAVPAASAGCATVRSRGPWTVADASTAEEPTSLTHIISFQHATFAAGGLRSRLYLSNGAEVHRTDDTGCTWKEAYTLGATGAAALPGDPGRAPVLAQAQYSILGVAARPVAVGARPAAGKDPVYVLMANTDGFFTGLAQNVAGVWPHYVARSLDGGTTWQTAPLEAKLDGAPVATPVTGDGLNGGQVVVSPADPRTAYLVVDTRDPRVVDATSLEFGGLYVTRDAGATWSFVVPQPIYRKVVPDPADPVTVYVSDDKTVGAVTVGAASKRRTLLTVGANETLANLDAVHVPHRPAMLLATASSLDPVLKVSTPVAYRSADGGRTWLRLPFTAGIASAGSQVFAGGGAWLTATGDIIAMKNVGGSGAATTVLFRWDARRRAWAKSQLQRPPLSPGFTSIGVTTLAPVDYAHRYFAFSGMQVAKASSAGNTAVVGVYDTAA
jgi:hypothetical protein